MAALPKEQLTKRLHTLNTSQQSIEGTASWCIFYRKDAKSVVHVWEAEFARSPADKKLALLFLANHILQESKKKGREFVDEFFRVLPKSLRVLSKGADDKIRKSLGRILQIWEERRVYGSSHLRSLKEAVGVGGHSSHDNNHSSTSAADKKRMQLLGSLADSVMSLNQAEERSGEWATKSLNSLRQGLTENGTLEELSTAVQLLRSYQTSLRSELAARDSVLKDLKALIDKQEDAKTRSDDQLRLCGVQQEKLEERLALLERKPTPVTALHTITGPLQSTPPYMQAPSPGYQQATPPYAPPQASTPPNTFASVPVTQLTAPDANLLGQLSSLAGMLNGGALNIPSIIPTVPAPTLPQAAVSALASLSNLPAPPSPQPPRMEEYSPSIANAPEAKNDMDTSALKVEDLDPAYLAATLANSDDLASKLASALAQLPPSLQQSPSALGSEDFNPADLAAALAGSDDLASSLANALAQLPPEEREAFQLDFKNLSQQPGDGDEEQEYNPEFGE